METAAPSETRRRQNSAEPARGRQLILFLSLGLNLALVLFVALAFRNVKSVPTIPSPDDTTYARTDVKRLAPRHRPISPWQRLESPDLVIYAANLRAAGCPPKTMRDILLPLIEEKFAHAESLVSEPTNFWASFSERQAAAAARAEQDSALRQKKDKAVEELLGFAWDLEELKHAYAGEAAGALGFLDYDRAEKFLCVADRASKQFERLENSHRIDRRTAVYQTWRKEAGEVVSQPEFEESELRGMLMIYQHRNPNLCNIGLNGSELRQLMSYRRELSNPLPASLLAGTDELVQEPDWAGEQQFNAKARSLLGDSRFIDYLKNCDASIERTVATLEKDNLPKSMALQFFDLRQDAIARAEEIRQRPLRRAEKRTQLAALRQSAIEQLTALANVSTDSPLLRFNMDWLQEIKNP